MDVSGQPVGPIFKGQSSECGTDRLFRNVDNYQTKSRNIPEELRCHLCGSGSMKSRRKQIISQASGPFPSIRR
jgi:hypothetical protein